MEYEHQKSKAKKSVEQKCSCFNYHSLESNHFTAKWAKIYLNAQSHIIGRDSYCPSIFPMRVPESIHVEILDASSHKKVIPDSDDKRDHYMKIWKSIIFTFRSTQTDQFNPNQYTLMEKCPCARYRTRSEGYKSETQPLRLSSKNLVEEEGKVKWQS